MSRRAGRTPEVDALFYALSGYTAPALQYANTARVALFGFTIYGDVRAEDWVARERLA